MIPRSAFDFEVKETKITFINFNDKKVSIKVPSHRVQFELDMLKKNNCTLLKVKDL